MAVTRRFYGLNYGAERGTITNGAATTSKDIEISFSQGDAAGSATEIERNKTYKNRDVVVAQLMELVEEIKTGKLPWPAPLV